MTQTNSKWESVAKASPLIFRFKYLTKEWSETNLRTRYHIHSSLQIFATCVGHINCKNILMSMAEQVNNREKLKQYCRQKHEAPVFCKCQQAPAPSPPPHPISQILSLEGFQLPLSQFHGSPFVDYSHPVLWLVGVSRPRLPPQMGVHACDGFHMSHLSSKSVLLKKFSFHLSSPSLFCSLEHPGWEWGYVTRWGQSDAN